MPLFSFTDQDLVASSQKYWFRGITLAGIGYGVNLALFILCIDLLRHRIFSGRGNVTRVDKVQRVWDIISLCYTIPVFGFATVSLALEAIIEERAFVHFRSTPAGPSVYLFNSVFGHITTLRPVYVAFICCHFLATGLLAWRCLTLYRMPPGNFSMCSFIPMWTVVMILPISLLFMSIGTGVLFVLDAIAPWKLPSPFSGPPWVIIWGSITVALLWILTGLIVVRLLTYRWITRNALGGLQQIRYTSLVAMFVESAGLLSSFSVFFIVVFSLRSPTLVMAALLLTQVQALSSLLTIYQITSRKAWSQDVVQSPSMLSFASVIDDPTGGPNESERKYDGEEKDEIEARTHSVGDSTAIQKAGGSECDGQARQLPFEPAAQL